MAYITIAELDSVDKHVKQRATIEKINAAIDELHALVAAKYKILAQPLAKLTGDNLKKFKVSRCCVDCF